MSNTIEIKAPTFPESVQSGTIVRWHKKQGDFVKLDELIVEIETEKIVLEVSAHSEGVIESILKQENEEVESNETIGVISKQSVATNSSVPKHTTIPDINPSAKKMMTKSGLKLDQILGTGKDGRITKEDVLKTIEQPPQSTAEAPVNKQEKDTRTATTTLKPATDYRSKIAAEGSRERKKMSPIRKRISERLLQSVQTTAMLTTFNEVDLHSVIDIRKRHRDSVQKQYGVKLGFMSFFLKASAIALQKFPIVNAQIDGTDIVYNNQCHISVAISTDYGLVVPVLKDVHNMSLIDIEMAILNVSQRARENKLGLDEMTGGTFTITNGGIFGSMLSTPIINIPQSAILGMHNIIERPIAMDGKVVIRPMMYLALSYDHRLIDGKDAVQCLVEIKRCLEDPSYILLS